MNYVIATIKSWNIENARQLQASDPSNTWHLITDPKELTAERIAAIQPRYVFFPHWSWFIPTELFSAVECVVFHMTDLPYGRGGSPLQNLIVRGHRETKVSALRVESGMDTGDIYLKRPLDLSGSAQEIYERASDVVFDMIREIVRTEPVPTPQVGEPTVFRRRKPEEGDLAGLTDPVSIYDHIRMLDAEGYPNAFLIRNGMRIEFSEARLENGVVTARARIILL